jgi:nitrogen regulatory protein PII
LRKVESIVSCEKLDILHKELLKAGIHKMMAAEVKDFGSHPEHREIYRSEAYSIDSLARVKVEIIVPQNKVSTVVSILMSKAQTGRGDGDKIFVSSVNDVSRSFLDEKGESD